MRDRQALQTASHTLRGDGAVGEGLLWKDAEELLTAVAVQRVAGSGLILQLGGDRLENLITGLMTVGVVVRLEVIDIQECHAVPVPVPCHAGFEQLEVLLEGAAIAQSGQRISPGDGGELGIEPYELAALVGQLAV